MRAPAAQEMKPVEVHAITADHDGKTLVGLRFNQPLQGLMMTPEFARDVALSLLERVSIAEGRTLPAPPAEAPSNG